MELSAEIVSVGTEHLLGQIVDTHSPTFSRLLAEFGISCRRRTTVGDNQARVVAVLREALARADLVCTIGGLGPTQDDLTRDAIAEALGDPLVLDPEAERRIREILALRKLSWSDSLLRQAYRPESARLIENPAGTAPGLICEKGGKRVIALPGPKAEFEPMASGPVREYLASLETGRVFVSRTLRICGMGESVVEDRLGALMVSENPTVAPYAHPGEVHLRLTVGAASLEEGEKLIEPLESQIRAILGDRVFGVDDTTLEEAVLAKLRGMGKTLAIAESMTGGWLGERLTSVPGASEVFLGGAIPYTEAAKRMFGVDETLLDREGPVSEACARELAHAAKCALGADYAVSITGNAGPTADRGDQPVGLVFVGLAGPSGVTVHETRYRSGREDVRRRAVQWALTLLWDALLE
ncbi:MAG: competence/damage-inducible protein A [Fimbriimonas ginsengisoli]|uniref:CinA-like protein n=1 Tax=Fimbriimonas ginsengisoli TaxID=1005039 RepID=A0A931LTW5_FIMGI|nr:competence/damage-inducible protein A [Fimbriimonas ginsengisoli]